MLLQLLAEAFVFKCFVLYLTIIVYMNFPLQIIVIAGAFLYYYAPGQTVDKNGGGVKIPLPPEFGK